VSISSELLARRNSEGVWDPHEIVSWAQANPSSALYGALDWDDAHAAQQHRLWQVRQLISVHIVDDVGRRTTFSLMSDRVSGGGYRELEDVFDNAAMREAALRQALDELNRTRARYEHLEELAAVYAEIDRVQVPARVSQRRSRSRNVSDQPSV
jgi:hypothetical protein